MKVEMAGSPRAVARGKWRRTTSGELSGNNRSVKGRISAVLATLLVFAAVACGESDTPIPVAARRDTSSVETTTTARPSTSTTTSTSTSTTTSSTTTTAPPPPPPPPTTAVPPGVGVTRVVDGDTIEVHGGHRVRLIGIDTPERGECGYHEASDALRRLIASRPVQLVPGARDDVDRYGRLLRYVEVGGVDLNLEMIRAGHAIARYDSRDGYGRHPREDSYVAADAASPPAGGCQRGAVAPPTTVAPPPSPGGGTDPRFGTCREAKANGYGPYVQGKDIEYDWYRDADRDGIVCE